MEDNNSFLYPQGFHIGALFLIVKNVGNNNFDYPFNPETYQPRELGTFERECRYRMWALMEMGILEDHRLTDTPWSYQNLTDRGQRIYELMGAVQYPENFFERKARDSWDMQLTPEAYIQFTKTLKDTNPELFSLLHEAIVGMDACQDLISYFIYKGARQIAKDALYREYFSNPFVRETYHRRGLTAPKESYETSRRRMSVLIGLLESVGVVSGYSAKVSEPVTLLESSENLTEEYEKEVEEKTEEAIKDLPLGEIESRLTELEEQLSRVAPTTRMRNRSSSVSYPRNPTLPPLLKKKQNYVCQVCGVAGFETPQGKFMSHHHMIPMNRGRDYGSNPDVPSNILVVCSWCHAKLEHGAIQLKREIFEDLLTRNVISQNKFGDLRRLNLI